MEKEREKEEEDGEEEGDLKKKKMDRRGSWRNSFVRRRQVRDGGVTPYGVGRVPAVPLAAPFVRRGSAKGPNERVGWRRGRDGRAPDAGGSVRAPFFLPSLSLSLSSVA